MLGRPNAFRCPNLGRHVSASTSVESKHFSSVGNFASLEGTLWSSGERGFICTVKPLPNTKSQIFQKRGHFHAPGEISTGEPLLKFSGVCAWRGGGSPLEHPLNSTLSCVYLLHLLNILRYGKSITPSSSY